MAKIRELFDPGKPIDRRIEKVIQYDGKNEDLLRQEITEYVVTANIESGFTKLLDQLDEGMSGDREHEIGIWVSGFYGSGKSSFTKYLGMALDPTRKLLGRGFRDWLQDQFSSQALKARLSTVAKKHPMTVFLLDLSTEALVGPTMQSVSTVLYHKVLEWAGYSRERKIAHLELMLDKDGKRKQFEDLFTEVSKGESWANVKNQPMTALTYARKVAPRLYPDLWAKPEDFDAVNPDTVEAEDARVARMLRIISEKGGSRNVLFVIDEVGQYVAPDDDRITNLQGLAQNLKRLGNGKAWIVATAQQTLTEDDARAAVNTPKLYKLKDRFPIPVHLEASDIREICHRRLLGKSAEGRKVLEGIFSAKGEKLRLLTQLKDAPGYGADLDKESFIDLYPFLPQHFDLLLKILGRLARTTGGVGLRSAIKVVQDVLIERGQRREALADAPRGTLATAVWFYDTLRQDIERSLRHAVEGVNKVREVFRGKDLHEQIAKAVAVLQVLEDFPLTRENLAALIHGSVDAESGTEEVRKAVDELIAAQGVPLKEVDGKLRFMSDRVRSLDLQRLEYSPNRSDRRDILTKTVQEVFHPQPTATVHGGKRVSAGLKLVLEGRIETVSGDREEVQIHLALTTEKDLPGLRTEHIAQSREPAGSRIIFAVGLEDSGFSDTVTDIYRSDRVANAPRTGVLDKEIEDYINSQRQQAARLREDLKKRLARGLLNGVFIFQGKETAVRTLDVDLLEAVKKQLTEAGARVYDKFPHAAVQAESATAERFLKTRDLSQITVAADPLGLCSGAARGNPVNMDQPALVDIKDYLDRNGTVDGQKLMEDFGRYPYGWSKDIVRYLVAALLTAGEIKLRANNQDLLTRTEAAVDAIRNVPKFNKTGISLRSERPDPAALLLARKRLLAITGEEVLPLEQNVTEAVQHHFPILQTQVAPLAVRLESLGLPGKERAARLQKTIQDILASEASIVKRLGAADSEANDDIVWARELLHALDNGLDEPICKALKLVEAIGALPDSGAPGQHRMSGSTIASDLKGLLAREDFHHHAPEIRRKVNDLEQAVGKALQSLVDERKERFDKGRNQILSLPEWNRIGEDVRERICTLLNPDSRPLKGIPEIMARRFDDADILDKARAEVLRLAKESEQQGNHDLTVLRLPRVIRTVDQLGVFAEVQVQAKKSLDSGKSVEIELE